MKFEYLMINWFIIFNNFILLHIFMITISKGEERKFRILDTVGEEDYQTIMDEWIKAADGFILLFAINDKESFDALK